ncbi:M55 family metallopeptidase [Streptomyces mexicanus]
MSVTGLVDAEDVQPHGRDYERGRRLMAETSTRAARCPRGDAVDITVNDARAAHALACCPRRVHPAARLVRGEPKQMGMLEGLVPEHDAMVCVGYHSRAARPRR